jgi:hypothetical protein
MAKQKPKGQKGKAKQRPIEDSHKKKGGKKKK